MTNSLGRAQSSLSENIFHKDECIRNGSEYQVDCIQQRQNVHSHQPIVKIIKLFRQFKINN